MSIDSDVSQDNQNNENQQENTTITKNKQEEKKNKQKSSKSKKDEDFIVLDIPDKLETLKGRIINCIIDTIKRKPLIKEKDLVLELVFNCEQARKFYEENHETQYFRFLIHDLAKKKKILKVKLKGDEKHTYYILPEQLNMFKK
ncbi:hypothetical protein V6M85_13905 [Sulfolobus tengchongensis]|uniref:Uncharacterized protein n=1 Tax=Sulfolobus tengchongensis TaxID=207809 RepID=A0AAX4L0F2_9CREN